MSSSDYGDESSGGSQGGGGFLTHIPAVLWQRRWFIIIPAILGIVGAVAVAILAPPVYRSSARLLVQSAQLSAAVLGDDAPEVIDRRVARIREQAISRPDLIALIEKYGLYKDMRKSKPLSDVIEKMRSSVLLAPVGADGGGGGDDKTISIDLAFDYFEPGPAQAVAQDLMQRILELDASGNSTQAAHRVQFLTDQARDLDRQVKDVQGKIAAINGRNGQVLSDSVPMIMGGGGSYDVQIAQLQRDNAQLVSQRNEARNSDQRDPAVAAAESALAAARAVYTENHPDVVLAKQRLAEARELAKSNTAKLPLQTIDDQIAFNNQQLAALRAAKAQDVGQVSSALSARSQAPLIRQQISQLQQELASLTSQYDGVSQKLMNARAGVKADDEQMGERLSVVDPPVVPDKPIWPNRLLIAAAGIIGGLGLGIVLALAVEIILRPIRDPAGLAAITGLPPLAVIPPIKPRPVPGKGRRWSIVPNFLRRSR